MSREILFRGKQITNGEWAEGSLVQTTAVSLKSFIAKSACYTFGKWDWNKCVEVDLNTICQYIGLLDKNGNWIYENDIIRDADEDMTMVVRWDEEKLRFVLDDYGYTGCLMEYGFDETAGEFDVVDTYGFDDFCSTNSFEVIGNIFNNPELIGK